MDGALAQWRIICFPPAKAGGNAFFLHFKCFILPKCMFCVLFYYSQRTYISRFGHKKSIFIPINLNTLASLITIKKRIITVNGTINE